MRVERQRACERACVSVCTHAGSLRHPAHATWPSGAGEARRAQLGGERRAARVEHGPLRSARVGGDAAQLRGGRRPTVWLDYRRLAGRAAGDGAGEADGAASVVRRDHRRADRAHATCVHTARSDHGRPARHLLTLRAAALGARHRCCHHHHCRHPPCVVLPPALGDKRARATALCHRVTAEWCVRARVVRTAPTACRSAGSVPSSARRS